MQQCIAVLNQMIVCSKQFKVLSDPMQSSMHLCVICGENYELEETSILP